MTKDAISKKKNCSVFFSPYFFFLNSSSLRIIDLDSRNLYVSNSMRAHHPYMFQLDSDKPQSWIIALQHNYLHTSAGNVT